jgi:hypothetical protein
MSVTLLEQVAEPLGTLGQHARGNAYLDVLGQDHDPDLGCRMCAVLLGDPLATRRCVP